MNFIGVVLPSTACEDVITNHIFCIKNINLSKTVEVPYKLEGF